MVFVESSCTVRTNGRNVEWTPKQYQTPGKDTARNGLESASEIC